LSKTETVRSRVCTEWPTVIGVENTPGLEMSDRALDGSAQPVDLYVEFYLPVKQFSASRFLELGN